LLASAWKRTIHLFVVTESEAATAVAATHALDMQHT
jgi:hypothetical protein